MTELRSTVLQRGPARFDMASQKLPYELHETDAEISRGLVSRLYRYAVRELNGSGFDVSGWDCEVYTTDGNLRPSDRDYTVEFVNSKGGKIGVCGILTTNGHPCVDHGIFAERA